MCRDMDDQQLDQLAERIAQKMRGICPGACGLSPDARAEMAHVMGVIKDQGDQDYARGAEKLRRLFQLVARLDTVSTWVGRAIIIFIALGILKLLGQWQSVGFIEWLKRIITGGQ